MGCHGWTGVSPVSRHATLTGVRSVNDPSATNVAQVVLHGVHRDTPEGLLLMPAFGQAYTDREIAAVARSEEHTSELQSLMRISYPVFCLKKKKNCIPRPNQHNTT